MFKAYKSVAVGTTANAPDWQKLEVRKGTIKQWVIFFDPEAANLLHVRIEYHGLQIMPFSGSMWMVGFFSDTPFEDNIELDQPPYELDIFAYNEDDSYPHEYYIHPIIIPEKPFTVEAPSEGIWAGFKSLFGGGD